MALPVEETGKRRSTLWLVRSIFKKPYRVWLVRFAKLLEANSSSDEDLDHLFQMAEVLGSFAALLETSRHLHESALAWQDLRDVARILGSRDFARFLAEQGGALREAVDLQQAMASADSRRHLTRSVELAKRAKAIAPVLENLSRMSDERLRTVADALNDALAAPATSFAASCKAAALLTSALADASPEAEAMRALLTGLVLVLEATASAPWQKQILRLATSVLSAAQGSRGEEVVRLLERLLDLVAARGTDAAVPLDKAVSLLAAAETRDLARSVLELVTEATPQLKKGLSQLIAARAGGYRGEEYHLVPDIYGSNFHLLHDIRQDADFMAVAEPVVRDEQSLLYYDRLYTLYEALSSVCRLHPRVKLNVAEIGVYQGGTSCFLCGLLRKLHGGNAVFFAVDTFEGHSTLDLPQGTEGLHSPKKFAKTSVERVTQLLAEFPFVTVIKSRIQECAERLEPKTFHFVHLDVDIYEPMAFSLRFFLPRLAVGGVICVDDYNKTSCPGVRRAVEEAVASAPCAVVKLYTQMAQCLLIRTAPEGEARS